MPAFLSADLVSRGQETPAFAQRVVDWQRVHGRRGLPWQATCDPYHVWLSEIMLQQTQVQTVRAYYARFLARFPDVTALAAAPEQDVMALWSGLGYYARARNLHACARAVVADWGGHFPRTAAQLGTLPGIGRSTAAAIAAFCFGERASILDANVQRVLARVFAVGDDLSRAAPQRALWRRAEMLLPQDAADMAAYTQGMMDLGATVCTPRAPHCEVCPLRAVCAAAQAGNPEAYPVKRAPVARQQRVLWLVDLRAPDGGVWLVRRPPHGIWAGLFCLPEFANWEQALTALHAEGVRDAVEHARFTHTLTHRTLDVHVLRANSAIGLGSTGAWYGTQAWPGLGLPAPVRAYLQARTGRDGELF